MGSSSSIGKLLPIFVLGVPRSGTTLVTRFIRASYEIEGLNSRIEWVAGQRWLPIKFAGVFREWIANGHPSNGQLLWDQALSTGDAVFSDRLQRIISRKPGDSKAWIAKKISNVGFIPNLLKLFPQSLILIVQRDPVDTVLSICEQRVKKLGDVNIRWGVFLEDVSQQHLDPIIDCARQFASIHWEIERQTSSYPQIVKIGYREFCTDPQVVLRKLKPFIGKVSYPHSWTESIVTRDRVSSVDQIEKIRSVLGNDLFSKLSNS